MRLSAQELQHLKESVNTFSPPSGLKLYLYGSRVHDHLKGGDIDLFITVPPSEVINWKGKRLDLLIEVKKRLGDQKIDLSILTELEIQSDPFFRTVASDSLLIFEVTSHSNG